MAGFVQDNLSTDQVGGSVCFRMIQAHDIYYALYFYYYYLSSTSDHQALDPGVWGPLVNGTGFMQKLLLCLHAYLNVVVI